jgi:hypothetical protein
MKERHLTGYEEVVRGSAVYDVRFRRINPEDYSKPM